AHWLVDHFDLLDYPWRGLGVLQVAAAIGAVLQRVLMALIDLFGGKKRPLMPRVAGLSATAAFFAFALGATLGWLYDITGRRFGGITRMFPRCCQRSFQFSDACLQPLALRAPCPGIALIHDRTILPDRTKTEKISWRGRESLPIPNTIGRRPGRAGIS